MRKLTLVVLLAGSCYALTPNEVCNQAFKTYFDPAELGPAIQKDCIAADCDLILDSILANTKALRDYAETLKNQETYLANKAAGEWCLQNNFDPGSAQCVRYRDEKMATVNANYQARQAIATDYQYKMNPYYFGMVSSGQCMDESVGIARQITPIFRITKTRFDLLGRLR